MTSAVTVLDLLQVAPENKDAIIAPETGIRVSYGALRRQVQAVADALAAIGIRRGDRVAMALPNGLPAIVCFLAASAAATAAPLNPAYRHEEFCFYLQDTSARVLLCPPSGAEEARRAAADCEIPVYAVGMDEHGMVSVTGATPEASATAPSGNDIALVLHTSGSTGRPKRVPLQHRNLALSAANVAKTYALTADDVSMCVMPLFHVHGIVASTLATLFTGGTVVVPTGFTPLAFSRLVKEQRPTWYSAVPTIHQLVLGRMRGADPMRDTSLRFIRSCSASLAPEIMLKLEDTFGVPVLEAYGMTEAAHQMASNPLPPAKRKPGSVGVATGLAISIMDEKGNHLPCGQRGEVVIKGANVFGGYENNPEANAASFVDGWFRTGDQGVLDQAGYLQLTGRLKELINRAGEKIAPRRIDEVLMTHPAVAEAVCFGVPHPTLGEEVAAAVVLLQPESEAVLLNFCRDRLAQFECPKKLYIVETLPRTATGKIQRRNVAAAFAKELVA